MGVNCEGLFWFDIQVTNMFFKLFLFGLLCTLVLAEEQVTNEEPEEETGLSSLPIPGVLGELSISEGTLRALSMAGAVVTGVAGFAALLSFLLPLLGFRTCAITGSCDQETTSYSAGSNSVYDNQPTFSGYQYNSGFKKRSLEYVGPILKALSSAYDKYGPPAQQRKLTDSKTK